MVTTTNLCPISALWYFVLMMAGINSRQNNLHEHRALVLYIAVQYTAVHLSVAQCTALQFTIGGNKFFVNFAGMQKKSSEHIRSSYKQYDFC